MTTHYDVETQCNDLERIVDDAGLAETVAMLASVCYAKQQHIEENWQDMSLAALWGRIAGQLDRVSSEAYRLKLNR